MKPFEHYLVGGAVRDALLGRVVKERDWVVVGETPQAMLARGFTQVGRDFPVFLHPETAEEYALARTERKTGPGHGGFSFEVGGEVTLENDLLRRDLTINAIAQKPDGSLVDPFGGQADLKNKVLRHVSPAFGEDPLRVFRLCRFAATFPEFAIAKETVAIAAKLSASGSLEELAAERVWAELHKALLADQSQRFWQSLQLCGALAPWFIELNSSTSIGPGDPLNRYASLGWFVSDIAKLTKRLKAPKDFQVLACAVARDGRVLAGWKNLSADELFVCLKRNGVLRGSPLADRLIGIIEACAKVDLKQLREVCEKIQKVSSADVPVGLTGKAVGDAIKLKQLEIIRLAF